MSYKFFQNKSCPFFPCHEVINEAEFNCLMCYCPLYYIKDCGGNYTFADNIKDCSECVKNHLDYDFVIDKIKEYNNSLENK